MFKVGDKAKGFKFDDGTDSVIYLTCMDELEGIVGEVVSVGVNSFSILFQGRGRWGYPTSLWHLAKVEEEVSFKKGDRVKFIESSIASGMIDAKEDDVFTVKESYERAVTLEELQGCYHVTHFEHVKEEIMNSTEEQEIKWEVGQEVWCLIFGKGRVDYIGKEKDISVAFEKDDGIRWYTSDGKYFEDANRTLFFSEPKIEAEKFPPKKPFVTKLKKGDVILVKVKDDLYGEGAVRTVYGEIDDRIYISENHHYFLKKDILSIRVLSEEIIFD